MPEKEMTDKLKKLIDKCCDIATRVHEGQYRNDMDTPYVQHCIKVAEYVKLLGYPELMPVAFLHDVMEDAGLTREHLLDEKVPEDVIDLVEVLTHKDNEKYVDYIRRVCKDNKAIVVKLADIVHNLSDKPTEKQKMKYLGALFLMINSKTEIILNMIKGVMF